MTIADMLEAVLDTMPSVAQQREALASIFAQMPDVKQVFTQMPSAIQPAHLPALMIVPEDVTYNVPYAGQLDILRDWLIRVYVAQFIEGREYEMEKAGEPFLDILPLVVAAHPTVRLNSGLGFELFPLSGSSLQALAYNNQTYLGASVSIRTVISVRVPRLVP